MAPNLTPKLLLALVLSMTTFSATSGSSSNIVFKETHMSMFLHDWYGVNDPNITDIPVAGPLGKLWFYDQFGTIIVSDNPLTEGRSPNSTLVGRTPGIFVASALDGNSGVALFTVVFTNKEYNGSTIEVLGNSKVMEPVRELAVLSGTGKFRFARGYATCETLVTDTPNKYSLVRFNITVQHQ